MGPYSVLRLAKCTRLRGFPVGRVAQVVGLDDSVKSHIAIGA
jgi:hypothetical protein